MIYRMKERMTSILSPIVGYFMCYNGNNNIALMILKSEKLPQFGLFSVLKHEVGMNSNVYQQGTVNLYLNLVHTARHIKRVCLV